MKTSSQEITMTDRMIPKRGILIGPLDFRLPSQGTPFFAVTNVLSSTSEYLFFSSLKPVSTYPCPKSQ